MEERLPSMQKPWARLSVLHKLGVMVYACKPSPWWIEAGRLTIQGHSCYYIVSSGAVWATQDSE